MINELIIFGASGDLGNVTAKFMLEMNYDRFHLYGKNFPEKILRNNVFYHEVGDLSVEENVKDAFKYLDPGMSSVFYLLSTIGGYKGSDEIQNTDVKDINFMLNKNFITSFLISKYFVNLVKQSKSGSICFISSITVSEQWKGNFAYRVSKNALNYLVKSLAKEGREYNFSANVIAPSSLDTEKNREWNKDKSKVIGLDVIAEFVNDIFENYKSLTGNIFEMPGSIVDRDY